jgi:hypothetical protein
MTAAPDHRPQTLDEARHLLRDALVKPAPATVAVTPEAPAQPQPSAPAAEDLGAIGRLTLELTRRAQAELHLTSKINGLESRLREREAAQNRLETEVDALRARLKASSESAAGGRNVDPGSGQTPEPQKTGVRDPHLTEPRKRYELAPPWVLWFALGTLAALMLAALYLLFQTLHDTQKLERERRRTARPEETARTASPAPTHHQYLSEVLTETELQSVP